jgi:tetratricopeptide (TPR) repeat protein
VHLHSGQARAAISSERREEAPFMTQQPFQPLLIDLLHQAQSSQKAFFEQLPATELAAIGTPDFWAAKDHLAHITFWQQRLALRLQALLEHQPQPDTQDFIQMNPIIFEENRERPWADLLAESDHVYADLISLTERLTEEDLTASNRFDWLPNGSPLYTSFMGNCYEHAQIHLAQYFQDRHNPDQALATYEEWANRVIEAEVPTLLKGYMLYNLACFYATHNRLEQAAPTLQQAFVFYPEIREYSLTDPDLVALRPASAE